MNNYTAYLMLHVLGTGVYQVKIMSDSVPTQSFSEGVWVQAMKADGPSYGEAVSTLKHNLDLYWINKD